MNPTAREILIPAGSRDCQVLLAPAADAIRQGKLVIFPTETVYGIGARADMPEAVAALFQAKRRPADKPVAYHVGSWEMLEHITGPLPPELAAVMRPRLPGPFTFLITAGNGKTGIRYPAHPVACRFLELCGVPVVATSANLSGEPSPVAAEMTAALWSRAAWVINAGPTEKKLDSTVVDLTVDPPICLRQGSLPWPA